MYENKKGRFEKREREKEISSMVRTDSFTYLLAEELAKGAGGKKRRQTVGSSRPALNRKRFCLRYVRKNGELVTCTYVYVILEWI